MSNNILEIENQNLFTDLDNNSAELISGGAVTITNTSHRQIKFFYGGSNHKLQTGTLQAGGSLTLNHESIAVFDNVVGDGKNSFSWKTLDHGHYEFNLNHHTLTLNSSNGGGGGGLIDEEWNP